MSNLLLYVEENLIFTPEQCYEEEATVSNGDNKKLPEDNSNVPLISPQSTLHDMPYKPSPEFILPDKQKNGIEEERVHKQTVRKETEPTAFTFHNSNTNPFLQDERVYSQVKNDITPQTFMQLWHENLQLQMQITGTLNVLLNKVMKDSANDGSCHSTNNENILNTIRNTLLLSSKQVALPVDSLNANNADIYRGTIAPTANAYSRNTSLNNDFMNTAYPVECSPSAVNQQLLTTTSYNKTHDFNTCAEIPSQNVDMQNAFRSITSMNSTFSMPKNNNFDAVNQYVESQQTVRKSKIPPGFEAFNNTVKLDQQHYSANNVNTDFPISANSPVHNDMTVKETNPFRLSLAGKLRIPDAQEENGLRSDDLSILHKSHEPVVEYDLISFENDNSKTKYANRNTLTDCKDTSFDQYEYVVTDSVNNTNSIKRNSFPSNGTSLNYKWNVNDVTNTVSKLIIDDQPISQHVRDREVHCLQPPNKFLVRHAEQFVEKTNRHGRMGIADIASCNPSSCLQDNDFVASREMFSCKATSENFTRSLNYDSSDCRSSTMLPTNSLESPTPANNANTDEGYLTRSSTSHTLYSSSPILQLSNTEAQCNQKSMAQSLPYLNSECTDTWSTSSKHNMAYSVSERNREQVTYNEHQQQSHEKSSGLEHMLESHLKVVEETASKHASESTEISQHLSSHCKLIFQIVELPKSIIHIFHYQREGWLLVDEFVKAFTEFKATSSMINLLHVLNVHVRFEEIDRAQTKLEVASSSSILPKATRDIINGSSKLHLMLLKSALKVLHKLEIISQKDINDVFVHENYVHGSIVHEIWLIANAYRQLIYNIECDQ